MSLLVRKIKDVSLLRLPNNIYIFKKIYLFMRDTQRQGQRHRQRGKQAPCRKPDVGLKPGTPGSCPGPKANTQLLSHPGVPPSVLLKFISSLDDATSL